MIAKFIILCLLLWPVSYLLFIFFTWIDCGLFIEPYGEWSSIGKVMKEFFWNEESQRYDFWTGFPYFRNGSFSLCIGCGYNNCSCNRNPFQNSY